MLAIQSMKGGPQPPVVHSHMQEKPRTSIQPRTPRFHTPPRGNMPYQFASFRITSQLKPENKKKEEAIQAEIKRETDLQQFTLNFYDTVKKALSLPQITEANALSYIVKLNVLNKNYELMRKNYFTNSDNHQFQGNTDQEKWIEFLEELYMTSSNQILVFKRFLHKLVELKLKETLNDLKLQYNSDSLNQMTMKDITPYIENLTQLLNQYALHQEQDQGNNKNLHQVILVNEANYFITHLKKLRSNMKNKIQEQTAALVGEIEEVDPYEPAPALSELENLMIPNESFKKVLNNLKNDIEDRITLYQEDKINGLYAFMCIRNLIMKLPNIEKDSRAGDFSNDINKLYDRSANFDSEIKIDFYRQVENLEENFKNDDGSALFNESQIEEIIALKNQISHYRMYDIYPNNKKHLEGAWNKLGMINVVITKKLLTLLRLSINNKKLQKKMENLPYKIQEYYFELYQQFITDLESKQAIREDLLPQHNWNINFFKRLLKENAEK